MHAKKTGQRYIWKKLPSGESFEQKRISHFASLGNYLGLPCLAIFRRLSLFPIPLSPLVQPNTVRIGNRGIFLGVFFSQGVVVAVRTTTDEPPTTAANTCLRSAEHIQTHNSFP